MSTTPDAPAPAAREQPTKTTSRLLVGLTGLAIVLIGGFIAFLFHSQGMAPETQNAWGAILVTLGGLLGALDATFSMSKSGQASYVLAASWSGVVLGGILIAVASFVMAAA